LAVAQAVAHIGEPSIATNPAAKSLNAMAAMLEWREFLAALLAISFDHHSIFSFRLPRPLPFNLPVYTTYSSIRLWLFYGTLVKIVTKSGT
jgi:hypothetical protein